MEQDLKRIKKVYGEAMSRFCRETFPTILEKEGLLPKLLEKHFERSRFLYEDIKKNNKVEDFKNYIYSLTEEKKQLFEVNKSPKELLNEAGYDLYECKTEKDIQSFKKYYAPGEELCTFDGGRLNSCRVFFAVKKNVLDIKRENFQKPERQDEYGTSVISIQFTRDISNTLSIKNRYNHHVVNPDATFLNNLDNIIPGLTKSFEKYYGIVQLNVNNGFEIPGYVYASDQKYYKYNYEIGNVYYCVDNVIIDKYRPVSFEKEKYIVLDYFILDLMNKKIYCYNELDYLVTKDCFISTINQISNIRIVKHGETREIIITTKNQNEIIIKIDKYNRIISYKNPEVVNLGNNFLHENVVLSELELPNVKTIGYDFCYNNTNLSMLNFPKLEAVAEDFLHNNNIINDVFMPCLTAIGHNFLRANCSLTKLKFESLKYVGDGFLLGNSILVELELPNLISVGDMFCYYNKNIKKLEFLTLRKTGDDFFACNTLLSSLNLPNLESVGFKFFSQNNSVINLNLPKLKSAGDNFFFFNNVLESVDLPMLESVNNHFLSFNNSLSKLTLNKLKTVGTSFCYMNNTLKVLELPSLEKTGHSFCRNNDSLVTVDVRNLSETDSDFLVKNTTIQNIELSNLKKPGQNFLKKHPTIGKKLKIRKMIVHKKINEIGNSILNKTTGIFKVEGNSKK